jgi:GNAT superfamily N-acetyltransferase
MEDPIFDQAWETMDAYFGPRDEMEGRELLRGWLSGRVQVAAPLRCRYSMVLARDGQGQIAGARDAFCVLEPAAGRVVVFLSHSLVLEPYRRSGLATLLRIAPIAIARQMLREAGLSDGPGSIAVTAEMEFIRPSDPGGPVRLVAYGRAGFGIVSAAHLPYCQPDFSPAVVAGAPPRPLPLFILVRVPGLEHEGAVSASLLEGVLRSIRAVHLAEFDPRLILPMLERELAVLARAGGGDIPLISPPGDMRRPELFFPFLSHCALASFPPELGGPRPEPEQEQAELLARWTFPSDSQVRFA